MSPGAALLLRHATGAPAAEPADALALACASYARLILMQVEALGAEDLGTFEACAEERDTLAGQIEALGPAAAADPDAAALVAEQLARCDEADRLLLERLVALRADAAAALAEHDARRPRVLAYGSAALPTPGSLDVRL